MEKNLLDDKNYTIRFFNDYWDCYHKGDDKYYLLMIENDVDNVMISKFIKAKNNRELRLITDLIRNNRLLVINYLMKLNDRYIDTLLYDLKSIIKTFFSSADINI